MLLPSVLLPSVHVFSRTVLYRLQCEGNVMSNNAQTEMNNKLGVITSRYVQVVHVHCSGCANGHRGSLTACIQSHNVYLLIT